MADGLPESIASLVSSVDTAPSFWQQGLLWSVLASSDQTGGAYSLMEQLMPASWCGYHPAPCTALPF